MSNAVRQTESNWTEYPSMYIKLLQGVADSIRKDTKLNKVSAVNTIEGAIHEHKALQAHRESLMNAREAGSDSDLLLKALMKGVARWETYKGYPALSNEGEVCTGSLRYATRLENGIPVVEVILRNALK